MSIIRLRIVSYFIIFLMSITSINCADVKRESIKVLLPPKHGDAYVVAHRGAHNGIPENTLAAYEAAIAMGVDFVEVDLRTTRDGHIVSIHNKEIDSYVINGEHGLVSEMTLEQLKQLDIGSRISPRWSNERIPAFEEILDLCKGRVGIYLDLKDAPVDKLVRFVKEWDMAGDILWYADIDELERIEELCPECILMPDPGPEENLPKVIERFQPSVIASVWRYYSQSFAAKCHQAGAIVIVDESAPTCWEDAIEWDGDGIQTDHPAQLIVFLKQRKR
ncbi:MAG: glycerophosphodiester phosphodiesterase family protein [Sedimentisphaerales bacterium]|nr:glycerophosphodiester phosphodiesterase family protein [Sedimentisphaerales bacterium]